MTAKGTGAGGGGRAGGGTGAGALEDDGQPVERDPALGGLDVQLLGRANPVDLELDPLVGAGRDHGGGWRSGGPRSVTFTSRTYGPASISSTSCIVGGRAGRPGRPGRTGGPGGTGRGLLELEFLHDEVEVVELGGARRGRDRGELRGAGLHGRADGDGGAAAAGSAAQDGGGGEDGEVRSCGAHVRPPDVDGRLHRQVFTRRWRGAQGLHCLYVTELID